MSKHKTYNGHESYNAWNVALWFSNDESLYRLARKYKIVYRNSKKAANAIMKDLEEIDFLKTPDNVKFSKHTIQLAIRYL